MAVKRPRGRPRVPDAERAAQVELRVPAPLLARLDDIVDYDRVQRGSADGRSPADVTRASVIREAIEEYVERRTPREAVEEYVARREGEIVEARVPTGDVEDVQVEEGRRIEAEDMRDEARALEGRRATPPAL